MFARFTCSAVALVALLAIGRTDEPKSDDKFPTFTTPKEWKAFEDTKSSVLPNLKMKRLTIGEGDKAVSVSLTNSPGLSGGVVANANRWRGQLKLDALGAEALGKTLETIKVDGQEAHLIDITGTNPKDKDERIIGLIVTHNEHTLFVKMSGPPKAVGDQKKAFDEFVKTIRFVK